MKKRPLSLGFFDGRVRICCYLQGKRAQPERAQHRRRSHRVSRESARNPHSKPVWVILNIKLVPNWPWPRLWPRLWPRPWPRDQGPGTRDQGTGTRDQGPGTRDQGPGTRDQGPGPRDQGPGARDQGTSKTFPWCLLRSHLQERTK